MTVYEVTTQAELDDAIKAATIFDAVTIRSSSGVWLYLSSSDSAMVRAYGSAMVRAYGSATVEAYDSATVRAYDSATVEAAKYVAVHIFSARATINGGVPIDLTKLDLKKLDDWIDYTGCSVEDDTLTVYKAVRDDLKSAHQFHYPIGEQVTDPKWTDDHDCGGGLHFSPAPHQAREYDREATPVP